MKILNLENHSPPPNIVTGQKDFCKSIGAEKKLEFGGNESDKLIPYNETEI